MCIERPDATRVKGVGMAPGGPMKPSIKIRPEMIAGGRMCSCHNPDSSRKQHLFILIS